MSTHPAPRKGLFPALIKQWRRHRGLSQLDLALVADVSSRHVSFLETGRSVPSVEMVLKLAEALDVSLRQANEMLRAAGHEPFYPERDLSRAALPDEIAEALELMKAHHEPFPLMVVDRLYDLIDANAGALALFEAALPGFAASAAVRRPNLVRMTFDPHGVRHALINFDEIGRALLWRLQREVLADPGDGELRALLDEALSMPTVDRDWREVDLAVASSPTLPVRLQAGGRELCFLSMVTALQAPQIVTLDELRIETWFPCDRATADACHALLGEA